MSFLKLPSLDQIKSMMNGSNAQEQKNLPEKTPERITVKNPDQFDLVTVHGLRETDTFENQVLYEINDVSNPHYYGVFLRQKPSDLYFLNGKLNIEGYTNSEVKSRSDFNYSSPDEFQFGDLAGVSYKEKDRNISLFEKREDAIAFAKEVSEKYNIPMQKADYIGLTMKSTNGTLIRFSADEGRYMKELEKEHGWSIVPEQNLTENRKKWVATAEELKAKLTPEMLGRAADASGVVIGAGSRETIDAPPKNQIIGNGADYNMGATTTNENKYSNNKLSSEPRGMSPD